MASIVGKIRFHVLGLGLAVLAAWLPGCGAGLLITPVFTRTELVETRVERDVWYARDKIAVIDVSGVLRNYRSPRLLGEGEHPVSLLREQLDKARRDPAVKGGHIADQLPRRQRHGLGADARRGCPLSRLW